MSKSSMIPQVYFDKVCSYFGGDAKKTWKWFQTPNPNLGSISPLDMIKAKRTDKLKNYIDTAMQGFTS